MDIVTGNIFADFVNEEQQIDGALQHKISVDAVITGYFHLSSHAAPSMPLQVMIILNGKRVA